MPEFSIIIPIYKVENYLNLCVESILCQSYKNFELILVDDGSPDKCGQICDDYASAEHRVRVVHKINGGLSSARNAGLNIAVGKYIIFVDSDDYWDDHLALEHIHRNLSETNADLLVFPVKRFYEEDNKFTYILEMDVDRNRVIDSDINSAINYLLENNIYRASACNKVIRKSVIDEHRMRFKEGYLSEDMDWCGDLLIHCSRFDFYENPFYVYRQKRIGSITSGKTEKLVADKLYMIEKGIRQAEALLSPQKELLASYYTYEYSVTLGVSGLVKNKVLLKKMKELQFCLDMYACCNKVKIVKKVKGFIGYGLTRQILIFFVKVKR